MNNRVASLPNWWCRFDSGRPLQASSQVSDGAGASEQGGERGQVSPTLRPKSSRAVPTCAHFDCAAPATDKWRGMPLCRGHFFLALQWEQAS